MRLETLDILRCPYCGGRLVVVDSLPRRDEGDEVLDATLACHCCVFPVVAGIPVLHLEADAKRAQQQIESGRGVEAMRTLLGVEPARAGAFEARAGAPGATYCELVSALGPNFEGGYFLYRFSDPTYLVADAVVRAVADAAMAPGGRAIDLCGGSGHLTRSLLDARSLPPFVADLHFSKLWLARRFTAPGCEAVCCDANAPLPFREAAFDVAVCSDAFHYVWTKRLFASEMTRLVGGTGAIAVTHAHNARQWNPSAGMPLPPEAYADLFAPMAPRLFGERRLLRDVVETGAVDLSRRESAEALDAEPALTIVAAGRADVFRRAADRSPTTVRGELRLNPLYDATPDGESLILRLAFPSADYEDEYGACRDYLPAEIAVERAERDALAEGRLTPALAGLVRRRVVLDLPKRYC